MAAIYRPLNNQLLAGLLERRQANYGGDIFRKGREAAWHGQRPSQGAGDAFCGPAAARRPAVPFFGYPAQTSISHVKLAIRKQVPLMYMRTSVSAAAGFGSPSAAN